MDEPDEDALEPDEDAYMTGLKTISWEWIRMGEIQKRWIMKIRLSSDDLSCLKSDSQLKILTFILQTENITPRSLIRTFVDLAQINKSSPWGTLQFIKSLSPLHQILLAEIKSCIRIYDEIRLGKLSIHFLFSLVAVLFVFEYLIGYVERGVWATYSDTSWEFRASYVSIELRLAAYFWFKFRACPAQPADRGHKRTRAAKGEPSVSCRNVRNKFEPRLKAFLTPTETRMKTVWLREYDTLEEAAIVFWVGAYYYDRWDRFNSDVLSWCQANLPPIPSHQNDKASWVLEQAKKYGNAIPHSSLVTDVEHVAEELQRGGSRVVAVTPGTGDGGGAAEEAAAESNSVFPVNNPLNETVDSSFFDRLPDFVDLPDSVDRPDLSLDDYAESGQGDVSGPGVLRSTLSLNPLGPFGDQGAAPQQQVVQHVQQSYEGAILPELIQRADIPEQHALELEFTESIQSTVQELLEQGWSCTFQHSVISTKFSIAFSRRGGQDLPKLTASNYSAFLELHKQGWKTTLEPTSSASPQDGDHSRLQPLSGSRDLCRACMKSQKIANL